MRRRTWNRATGLALLTVALLVVPGGESRLQADISAWKNTWSVEVQGYGFLGNRQLLRSIRLLDERREPPFDLSGSLLEDILFVVRGEVEEDGYLDATLHLEIESPDGERQQWRWGSDETPELAGDLVARRAWIRVDRGPLFYFREISVRGVDDLLPIAPKGYFYGIDFLIRTRRVRYFSPSRLSDGESNLLGALRQEGYLQASVSDRKVEMDHGNGAVRIELTINTGPRFVLRYWQALVTESPLANHQVPLRRFLREMPAHFDPESLPPGATLLEEGAPDEALHRARLQDLLASFRRDQLEDGHPDVEVGVYLRQVHSSENEVDVEARLLIYPGPEVTVSEIVFDSELTVLNRILFRQIGISPGDPLNLIQAQRSRRNLTRLRTFERVDVAVESGPGEERAIQFSLDPRPRWEISLLGGIGSYELLRGGIIAERRNILRRAHIARMQAFQSFKASRGNLRYTIPEIFGESVDVFSETEGLRREEVSFLRREVSQGVGIDFPLRGIGARSSVRYNFEWTRADDTTPEFRGRARESRVASIEGTIRRDRVDNLLFPERGYKVFSTLKLASPTIGGDTSFQRLTAGWSFHRPIGGGRIIHTDFTHGILTRIRGEEQDTPIGQRFFPGGENSLRGYTEGQASPRNQAGSFIGAESFTLVNLQIEQRLTEELSLNLFLDSLFQTADIADYPSTENLYSLGTGLSYRTLIGPIRLEYAHNLNPRDLDRRWAIHFSIGSPF